jgi:predicted GNAT family N-acyltransferase
MEPIQRSEKSAATNRTPGKFPEDYLLHSEHGRSLKTTKLYSLHQLQAAQIFTHTQVQLVEDRDVTTTSQHLMTQIELNSQARDN